MKCFFFIQLKYLDHTHLSLIHSCWHWQPDPPTVICSPHTSTHTLRVKGLWSQNACSAHLHWLCIVTHYSGGSGGFPVTTWTHTKGLWVTRLVWCQGAVIWRQVGRPQISQTKKKKNIYCLLKLLMWARRAGFRVLECWEKNEKAWCLWTRTLIAGEG